MKRRLNAKQQKLAEHGLQFVGPAISAFARKNPDLRGALKRVDAQSVAHHAVVMAALTYNPDKSLPQTYFGTAIRHALYREVLGQVKQDTRFKPVEEIIDRKPSPARTRAKQRLMRALRMLTAYERTLLEDRLVEQITLEQLGIEQNCDPRTIKRRLRLALEKLKNAESQLP